MIKKYEVPYNFSKRLLKFYSQNRLFISYLFLPPYSEDSINTRTSIETSRKGSCYMPKSREEYESHLSYISDLGLPFLILWQSPKSVMEESVFKYYRGLGARGFIIGNDVNAQRIKNFDSSLLVVGSLVQRICSDVLYRDLSAYDNVLLYYPYNRALEALKLLSPIKEKLILMPNTMCHIDCPSMFHWFARDKKEFLREGYCPAINNFKNTGFIYPSHLNLFDDLVGGYKLQGREYSTDLLIYTCKIFFQRESPVELLEAFIGEEQTKEMEEYFQKCCLNEYYNIRSSDLIEGRIKY